MDVEETGAECRHHSTPLEFIPPPFAVQLRYRRCCRTCAPASVPCSGQHWTAESHLSLPLVPPCLLPCLCFPCPSPHDGSFTLSLWTFASPTFHVARGFSSILYVRVAELQTCSPDPDFSLYFETHVCLQDTLPGCPVLPGCSTPHLTSRVHPGVHSLAYCLHARLCDSWVFFPALVVEAPSTVSSFIRSSLSLPQLPTSVLKSLQSIL